jgi:GLPGLI family protein
VHLLLFKNIKIMKRLISSAAALILLTLTVKAQKPEAAQVLVHYKFSHVRDTTNRTHPYTENMVLLVGKTAGVYKSYDKIAADEQFKKAYALQVASSPDGRININRRSVGSSDQYYQYPNEQKLFVITNLLMNSYLIEEPMPAIDWKISSDTATFGGLLCQKATTHFKGRDYIVWFSPDMPVRTGPWKLGGLPGVILDAHDTKNEVIFKFDGIEKAAVAAVKPIAGADAAEKDVPPILRGLDDNLTTIALPASAIKASQKEFEKLKEGMQKNPNALIQGMSGPGGGGQRGDIVIKAAPGGPPKNVNPIELPEKK